MKMWVTFALGLGDQAEAEANRQLLYVRHESTGTRMDQILSIISHSKSNREGDEEI